MFDAVAAGPPDPMYTLKKNAEDDPCETKVDLGVGVYRNETGLCHKFDVIKKATQILTEKDLSHDYGLTTGDDTFLRHAAALLFGSDCAALQQQRIASVQTISGTGANHLGALFLSRVASGSKPTVYIGTPAWGNYKPLFELVGLPVASYRYYSDELQSVDFESCLRAVRTAPTGSIFVLQGCCHNPTGADLSQDQWIVLAEEMKRAGHLPFVDIAYQGLGDGVDEDAFGVREMARVHTEMVVCQSFSKNFGLYGERLGALHIFSSGQTVASNVRDQLRSLIRWEFSSTPAFGARLVNIVFEDEGITKQWSTELESIKRRLKSNRSQLYDAITKRETPGDWSHILSEQGLFSYLKLTPDEVDQLVRHYHIHLPANGRINVSGLNESCVDRVAEAIHEVVTARPADHNSIDDSTPVPARM